MDQSICTAMAMLLHDARRIGEEAASALPPGLDEADAEAAQLLRAQLTLIERAIWFGAPSGACAAEPVWRAAGAILVLDIEGGEILADRMETIGDRISERTPHA